QALLPGERLTRCAVDLDECELPRAGQTGEVDDLVVARATAQSIRVRAARTLDQHLDRASHEALRALARATLDQLDQALHARHLFGVRGEPPGQARRLGAATGREDEGEGSVVADLLDDRQRLLEVGLGLPREADDDVGGQRHVGNVLANQRYAVEVALAVVGAPHRAQDARGAG